MSVGGVVSDFREVTSGVPQGSVLGPLLFLLYVNHVAAGVACEWKAFADNFKLYLSFPRDVQAVRLGVSSLQRDLNLVQSVSLSWNLSLNIDKCVFMRFYRGRLELEQIDDRTAYYLNGVVLELVDSFRDLGVLVDSRLRFHLHVRSVVRKASTLATSLLYSTINRSSVFMVSLFITHIRPILDYCSCVWNVGYLGDLRLLESVQRRWTKEIDGLGGVDYGERLKAMQLFSVRGRLLRSDLVKCWKIFHCSVDSGLSALFERAPDVGTRGHLFKLVVPRCQTDYKRRFFYSRCVQIWNRLPADVVQCDSLRGFKRALAEELGAVLYEFC